MEAGYYAINAVGGTLAGASGALEVQMLGVAKRNKAGEPYILANEYICGRLACALGLPAPPGTVAETTAGEKMFVCLRFSVGPTSLPPANPGHLVEDRPELAAGIVVFDCWVGNWDRHAGNLAYVRGVSGVGIFDHERALLRSENDSGAAEIEKLRDEPRLGANNILLKHIREIPDLAAWAQRIAVTPAELIAEISADAARMDICSVAESQAVTSVLEHRKTRIMNYLEAGRALLPKVTGWAVNP